jgi:hypothetical protein
MWEIMMSQIRIVYENAAIAQAQLLADCLTDRANVVFLGKERFPMGDATVNLLMQLESSCDAAFIVISATAAAWVARELATQRIMGNCNRVYPVFLPEVEIPDWWKQDDRYLTIDADICQNMQTLLNRPIGKAVVTND